MAQFETIEALKRGEAVTVDGIRFRPLNRNIRLGDFCIGQKNAPPVLFIVGNIRPGRWDYYPEGEDVPFSLGQCVAVEEIR